MYVLVFIKGVYFICLKVYIILLVLLFSFFSVNNSIILSSGCDYVFINIISHFNSVQFNSVHHASNGVKMLTLFRLNFLELVLIYCNNEGHTRRGKTISYGTDSSCRCLKNNNNTNLRRKQNQDDVNKINK